MIQKKAYIMTFVDSYPIFYKTEDIRKRFVTSVLKSYGYSLETPLPRYLYCVPTAFFFFLFLKTREFISELSLNAKAGTNNRIID